MKGLLLVVALFYTLSGFSQIFRADEVDNTLVNKYGNELQALKTKYKLPTAFGFSKSITNRDGQLNETIVMWYRTESGETEDRVVSARILHYKEGATPESTKSTDTQSEPGKTIVVRDTVTLIKRDTVVMEEVLNPDSLTFKTKKVLRNTRGYVITGSVMDRGNSIPVVLNTFKPDDKLDTYLDKRFTLHGVTLYNQNNQAVGTIFTSTSPSVLKYLIKVTKKEPVGWTNDQTNPCYLEEYVVPADWWNSNRVYWTWEKQLAYMRENFSESK